MARTHRSNPTRRQEWNPGRGRALKRAYHKAVRSAAKGNGSKGRTVARLASELARKGH